MEIPDEYLPYVRHDLILNINILKYEEIHSVCNEFSDVVYFVVLRKKQD